MGFQGRLRLHDKVLRDDLPPMFEALGIEFRCQGYETTMPVGDMTITQLEDSTAQSIRFRPDGVAIVRNRVYYAELKTVLETQQSPNYDFEMSPWEKAMASHKQGELVAYIFWPDQRVCWVNNARPDRIVVPNWRHNEQDYLRIRHQYTHMCPVYHSETKGGSGTIFGIIHWDRIRAMQTFDQFWKEVQGTWQGPKQLQMLLKSP